MNFHKHEKFIALEKSLPVEKIRWNGYGIWASMRTYLYYQYTRSQKGAAAMPSFLSLIRSLFLNPHLLFRKYDYWVISSSDQRKWIQGKWMDAHDCAEVLRTKALYWELPNPRHKHPVASAHRVSKLWFYTLERLFKVLKKTEVDPESRSVFDQFCENLNIDANLDDFVSRFRAEYCVTRFFLKRMKTKVVFLTTHFTNTARIAAAHSLGIEVVELQHGLISDSHPGYTYVKADGSLLPDVLITYGQNEVELLEKYELGKTTRLKPLGHFFLDQMSRSPEAKNGLPKSKSVRYRICFAAQDAIDEPFIRWLNRLAQLLPKDELVLIPRRKSIEWYREHGLMSSISFLNRNTYEVIASSDVHSTVFSTCALEALALDVPNVLMNIDGLSGQHFGHIAYPETPTWIVNEPEEFAKVIESGIWQGASPASAGEKYFKPGFRENFNQFLSQYAR
ncbi:MAG: hypothetical protein Kow0075_05080 [Salibacteraceae bacterium]